MTKKLFLLTLMIPAFLLPSCSGDMSTSTFARIRKNQAVSIATVPFGGPILFQRGEEFVGPDVSLGDRIVERIVQDVESNNEIKARWLGRSYGTLAAAVNNQEVELVIGAYGVTEDRKKEVVFSEPYYTSELVLVINPVQYDIRAADLVGKKVGVREGSAVEHFAQGKYGSSELTPFVTLDEAILALRRGGVHAVIDDRYMVAFSLDTVPGAAHLEIVPGTLGTLECAVALRQGDGRLLEMVNEVIGQVKSEKLYGQWLDEMVGDQFTRVSERQENRIVAAQPRRLVIRVSKDRNNDFDIYRMANLRFILTDHDSGDKFTSSRIDFKNRIGVSSTEVPPGTYRVSLPKMGLTPGDVTVTTGDPDQVTIRIQLRQDGNVVMTRS